MNEVNLVVKIMLGVLIISLTSLLFFSFVGQGLPINNPSTSQYFTLQNNLNITINNIGGVGNHTTIYDPFGNYNILNAIPKGLIGIINIIGAFFYLIIGFITLMINGFQIIFFTLFTLIPALFNTSAFGQLGFIFNIIEGVVLVIISIFAFYLITKIIFRRHD